MNVIKIPYTSIAPGILVEQSDNESGSMEPPVIRTIRADERDKPDAPDDILHSIWVISLGVRVLGIEP